VGEQVKKSFVFRSFLTGTFSLLLSLTVQATVGHAQTACDPQFMDAIEARGFVEAARENAQNQNLIFKPDSVFEYSCFTDHVPPVQQNADDLFRAASLTDVTTNPIGNYLTANFADDYLNSRYVAPVPALPAPPAGMCNAIANLWEVSRCMNFYNRDDLESFFDLTFYTSGEPRQLPTSLAACPAPPYTGLNMAVDIAYNNQTPAWTMGPYLRDGVDYIADPVNIFIRTGANVTGIDMFTDGECGTPIPTGMVVMDFTSPMGTTAFPEKVCVNPACVYMPDSDDCSMP